MDWYSKLEAWGYPRASELAPTLERLGFNPEVYTDPYQLGRDLRKYEARTKALGFEIPPEIVDFFKWLVDQIKKFVTENLPALSLMAGGGIATMFLPKWYKVIGIIPVVGGVYLMLKHYGVV
jgi:hypothetical protein